eukprot:TRINITY_DN4036_c0_g1_i6.p1 TRINITY_DN4036_c0_g1~~TRINITY_DN4036_c0_g1_i6.p1  ORF type:complete len:228 (-),score=-21.61 TRINITY_DN4036_c0_g1_i6:26-709(-)
MAVRRAIQSSTIFYYFGSPSHYKHKQSLYYYLFYSNYVNMSLCKTKTAYKFYTNRLNYRKFCRCEIINQNDIKNYILIRFTIKLKNLKSIKNLITQLIKQLGLPMVNQTKLVTEYQINWQKLNLSYKNNIQILHKLPQLQKILGSQNINSNDIKKLYNNQILFYAKKSKVLKNQLIRMIQKNYIIIKFYFMLKNLKYLKINYNSNNNNNNNYPCLQVPLNKGKPHVV